MVVKKQGLNDEIRYNIFAPSTQNANVFLLQTLEDNIALTKVKIERAEKLISGLGGEKERWTKVNK